MDFKTANDDWTDEERQKIGELTSPLSDRVAEFVAKELENNDKLGLLEVKSEVGDFESIARMKSADSMLKEMLSLIK